MERLELLKRVKEALESIYGERLRGVLLYGSEARGEARPDSDLDFMVLLQSPFIAWIERKRIIRALYPIQREIPERHLSFITVDAGIFQAQEFSLFRNAQREGVAL